MKQKMDKWFDHYDVLVAGRNIPSGSLTFQHISSVLSFDTMQKSLVIVVDYLDPELFLLFSRIKLIVTNQGSALSHLSILAREYSMPIIKCEFPPNILSNGTLEVNDTLKMITFSY